MDPDMTSPEMVEELLPIVPDSPPVMAKKLEVETKIVEDSLRKEKKMAPPPLPVTIHAPTPMTRLPSLQQLSHHLHIPSPSSSRTSPSPEQTSPPRLSLQTTPTSLAASPATGSSGGSPYTSSPSSRLRLPPSAMMRSLSSTTTPTLSKPRRLSESIHAKDLSSDSPTPSNTHSPGPGTGESTDPFKVDTPTPLTNLPQNTPPTPSSTTLKRQPSREYVQGYKDVPSLAAIRDRVRGMSISAPISEAAASPKEIGSVKMGSKAVPDGKENASPIIKSPSLTSASSDQSQVPSKGHPLAHAWTIFFDSKTYKPDPNAVGPDGAGLTDYEKSLLTVGRFETVEGFARHMNNLRLPSGLNRNSNYHMFKKGIRPMWEDPANAKGGKWVILFRGCPHLFDHAWANLTMALVGQVLDGDNLVCGIVASNRPKVDRIQIWTRGREDIAGLNALGSRACDLMGLEPGDLGSLSMEFQFNSEAHPPHNTFLHIPFQSVRPASFMAPPPISSTPARATPPGLPATPVHAHGHGLPANPRTLTVSTSNNSLAPPTPTMHFPLPATPDRATIQAAAPSPGGSGMRRTLSAQSGSSAFSGPMGAMGGVGKNRALSPRVSNSPLPVLSPSLAQ